MTDIGCTIKQLPPDLLIQSADTAARINPNNHPFLSGVIKLVGGFILDKLGLNPERIDSLEGAVEPQHIAVMTTKYWGAKGVDLTVGFMESTPGDLQSRILSHMNAWGSRCNVKFQLTNTSPKVRITRSGQGYWSFLGTDILHIPANQPTMCLQGFTMSTPESEFRRVVRHECGHVCGCPHEHMRQELVNRLDRAKTIIYFAQTQGWTAKETMQQVLTPLNQASIMGTPLADEDSIMCYQLPGSITTDSLPIRGGDDITENDYAFMAKMYPKPELPPPPSSGVSAKVVYENGKWSISGL